MTTSLADTLAQHNISVDDLEKAASVRIFEKVAAAENIDLSQMNGEQLNELYAHFEANVLPSVLAGPTAAEPTVEEKLASLTHEQAFELFDKQASAEGFDFSEATEEQLVGAFNYFVENVLPSMAENGFEPVGVEKSAEVEEAAAKLAEADILGRQMARGYADEMGKLASAMEHVPGKGSAHHASNTVRRGLEAARRSPGKALAIGAGAGAAGAGIGMGVKKLMDSRKNKEASIELNASDIQILAHLVNTSDAEGLQKAASLIVEGAAKLAEAPQLGVSDAKSVADRLRGAAGSAVSAAKAHPGKALAIGAGGAALAGGAAFGAKKLLDSRKDKEAAADAMLETLVEDRANELAAAWLTENGYGVAQ